MNHRMLTWSVRLLVTVATCLALLASTTAPAAAQSAGTLLSHSGGPTPVVSGESVSFTVSLENTGTVLLDPVNITSSVAGGCAVTNASILPGQTLTTTCVVANVTAPFTNVVSYTAFVPAFNITLMPTNGPSELPIEVFPNADDNEIIVALTCLAGNGRVDVNLVNNTTVAGLYEIELGNLAPRQLTIGAGDWGRRAFTGRPDGALTLRITRDGTEIFEETGQVSCDTNPVVVLSPEVQVINFCRNGDGFVLFQIANRTPMVRAWIIEFEGVPNRSTTTAPFGAAIRGTSGRPDGDYDVVIRTGGLNLSTTVTVDCD